MIPFSELGMYRHQLIAMLVRSSMSMLSHPLHRSHCSRVHLHYVVHDWQLQIWPGDVVSSICGTLLLESASLLPALPLDHAAMPWTPEQQSLSTNGPQRKQTKCMHKINVPHGVELLTQLFRRKASLLVATRLH